MLVLLDTHALVWLDQDEPSFGPEARKLADFALQHGQLAVSAISFWEVAMLISKGRLTMTLPPTTWRRNLLSLGLIEIPVDGEIGITVGQLNLHGDPADRLIVATTQLKGATLLTADRLILEWGGAVECHDVRR